MASATTGNDHHLPPLNSPNLRKLNASRFDKNHLLRSFVRSQDAHFASYALEGKAIAASWSTQVAEMAAYADDPLRDMELESGFGTPLLKPRAQIARNPGAILEERPVHEKEAESATRHDGRIADTPKAKESRSVSVSEFRKRGRGHDQKHKEERSSKRICSAAVPSTKKPPQPEAGTKAKAKGSRRKEAAVQEGELDQEHRNRLAERRERRRDKKAIVAPKPAYDRHESSSSEGSSGDRDTTRRKGARKEKNKKGLNMPAGLALMHGFSATNIGKNRLTLKPAAKAVGVFIKGKASAKTSVRKSKQSTKPRYDFSEERFLNKTNGGDAAETVAKSDCLSDDVDGSATGSTGSFEDCKANLPKTSKRNLPRTNSVVSVSGRDGGESTGFDPLSPSKRKSRREESPTWDIELEDGRLPSSNGSDRSAPGQAARDASGSVLLDTCAYTLKWTAPKEKVAQRPTEKTSASHHELQRSDSLSLAPSHSASQVGQQENSCQQSIMFSMYFSKPYVAPSDLLDTHKSYLTSQVAFREIEDHGQPVVFSEYFRLSEAPLECSAARNDAPQLSHSRQIYNHPGDYVSESVPEAVPAEETSLRLSVYPTQSEVSVVRETIQEQSDTTSRPLASPVVELPAGGFDICASLYPGSRSSSLGLPPGPQSPASSTRGIDLVAHPFSDQVYQHGSAVPPAFDASKGMQLDMSDLSGHQTALFSDWTAEISALSHDVTASVFHLDVVGSPYRTSRAPGHNLDILQDYLSDSHGDLLRSEEFAPSAEVALDVNAEEQYWALAEHAEYGEMMGHCETLVDHVGSSVDLEGHSAEISEVDEYETGGQDAFTVGYMQQFSQGRALLMGVTEAEVGCSYRGAEGISKFEEDVAKNLIGHWQPQRF